jgi:hypothetical protein
LKNNNHANLGMGRKRDKVLKMKNVVLVAFLNEPGAAFHIAKVRVGARAAFQDLAPKPLELMQIHSA